MMLLALLVIPLLGALALLFAPAARAKWIAMAASLITLVISIFAAFSFGSQWGTGDFGLDRDFPWLSEFGIGLRLGADSVSMLLILLTTLLMPLCVWGSFTAIKDRLKEYYGWMLVLEAAMVGVFVARDLIFFYICFEFTLVPMYFLIALYGGDNRAKACIKFFLYTFTGSMITLAGLLYVAWQYAAANDFAWSFAIADLTQYACTKLDAAQQAWVLLALMAGFAVKVPLFPLHTWLPLAHTEAPTAGSVILAGVLLKLGTYGLYRFVLPMVPLGVVEYAPLIAVISIIGILYAALICWVQSDIKKLVAYSSVSHLGFCVLGLFALNPLGVQGSVLYMLNHGLSTGALFFLVGMIYERYHTRDMNLLGGLSKRMPVWAFFMVFFVLSSVGLPGLNGFVSEFLCLIGAFTASSPDTAAAAIEQTDPELLDALLNQAMATTDPAAIHSLVSQGQDLVASGTVAAETAYADITHMPYPGVLGPWFAAFAALGMVFAAMYLLIMVGKVVFGPLKEPAAHEDHGPLLPVDLSFREIAILTPLAVLCVVIGLKPAWLTDAMDGAIDDTLTHYPAAVAKVQTMDRLDQMKEQLKQLRAIQDRMTVADPGAGRADLVMVTDGRPGSFGGTAR